MSTDLYLQNFSDRPIDVGAAVPLYLYPCERTPVSPELAQRLRRPIEQGDIELVDLSTFPPGDIRRLDTMDRLTSFLASPDPLDVGPNDPTVEACLMVWNWARTKLGMTASYDPRGSSGALSGELGFVEVRFKGHASHEMDMAQSKALQNLRRLIARRIKSYEARNGLHSAGFSRPR